MASVLGCSVTRPNLRPARTALVSGGGGGQPMPNSARRSAGTRSWWADRPPVDEDLVAVGLLDHRVLRGVTHALEVCHSDPLSLRIRVTAAASSPATPREHQNTRCTPCASPAPTGIPSGPTVATAFTTPP